MKVYIILKHVYGNTEIIETLSSKKKAEKFCEDLGYEYNKDQFCYLAKKREGYDIDGSSLEIHKQTVK